MTILKQIYHGRFGKQVMKIESTVVDLFKNKQTMHFLLNIQNLSHERRICGNKKRERGINKIILSSEIDFYDTNVK